MRLLYVILAAFTLSACAVGNTVNFAETPSVVTFQSKQSIGVLVVDQRPYVTSGDKATNFVGLRRGGYGNPFDVTTRTGKPFSEVVATALAAGLQNAGVNARAIKLKDNAEAVLVDMRGAGNDRAIRVTVLDWRTDIYFNMDVDYNLAMEVIDNTGKVLAKSSVMGLEERISEGSNAASEAGYAKIANATLSAKLNMLLNDPAVKAALQ